MSRTLFIAGNWKMNTSLDSGVALAAGITETIGQVEAVDLGVAPPFVYLPAVGAALAGGKILLMAQNMCSEDHGAFTGDISSAMLKDVGVRVVILGHSERRHVFGESNELVSRKVVKALADGLDVILCVGEQLADREGGRTMDIVGEQVRVGLEGVSKADMASVTIAYEPVWAIGTGVTASPDQAQETHAAIRELIGGLYDAEVTDALRIQYGGSVKPGNASELLAQPDIDGALIGGASLKVEDFTAIVEAGVALAQ